MRERYRVIGGLPLKHRLAAKFNPGVTDQSVRGGSNPHAKGDRHAPLSQTPVADQASQEAGGSCHPDTTKHHVGGPLDSGKHGRLVRRATAVPRRKERQQPIERHRAQPQRHRDT